MLNAEEVLLLFQYRQTDGKLGALAQLALCLDFALVHVNDLLYIGQSQSETFDVVLVAGVDTVELVEDLLQVLLLDALSCVAYGEVQLVVVVPCMDVDIDGLVGLAILHGIVHQIGDGILEVDLVDIDG